jgi:hypothetical protein
MASVAVTAASAAAALVPFEKELGVFAGEGRLEELFLSNGSSCSYSL